MTRERTAERTERLTRVLSMRQNDLTLVLANIHDPHNVSAIYRSADAFGIAALHLYYTDTPFPLLGRKSSGSARKWVESIRLKNPDELQHAMQGYTILATSCSPQAKPLGDYDLTHPTAVIMGNEHSGIPAELQTLVNGELYIPMYGLVQSFNVSVAAAIILYEASRQRKAAGMYDHSALSKEEFAAHLALWLEK